MILVICSTLIVIGTTMTLSLIGFRGFSDANMEGMAAFHLLLYFGSALQSGFTIGLYYSIDPAGPAALALLFSIVPAMRVMYLRT